MKDRLWFWGSYRNWATQQTLAGIYYNLTPHGHAYTPDLSRPADSQEFNQNGSLRLTWQASPRNKFNGQYQSAYQRRPYYGYSLGQLTSAPEAVYFSKSIPMYQCQMSWSSPVSNRLLLEGGWLYNRKNYWTVPQPANEPNQIPYSDLGTGFSWGNYSNTYGNNEGQNFNARFSGVVRDRLARVQDRRDVHAAVGGHRRQRREQRHDAAAAEQRAEAGHGLGDPVRVLREPEPELGRVRAGSMDDQALRR